MAKWRKEPNNWTDSSIRHYLSPEGRDIYHCLRSYAGGENGRWGYVERSEGVPYLRDHLAIRLDVSLDALESCIAKLIDLGIVEDEGGILHFARWDDEQAVPNGYKHKVKSPEQKEAYGRFMAEKYASEHPDWVHSKVEPILVKLANDGKIVVRESGSNGV